MHMLNVPANIHQIWVRKRSLFDNDISNVQNPIFNHSGDYFFNYIGKTFSSWFVFQAQDKQLVNLIW